MTWRIALEEEPEPGEFAVWCPELPDGVSAGVDVWQAKENIREAIHLFSEGSTLGLGPMAHVEKIAVGRGTFGGLPHTKLRRSDRAMVLNVRPSAEVTANGETRPQELSPPFLSTATKQYRLER